jgi:transcriptional regulator with XRE-family HTH domain
MALSISVRQVKAARALLGWSQEELAIRSGVSYPTVARLEADDRLGPLGGRDETAAKIMKALQDGGVTFTNGGEPGVKLKPGAKALEHRIEQLEDKIADLKPKAAGKPSPDTGMAMLRRARAKTELAMAKNKREKGGK